MPPRPACIASVTGVPIGTRFLFKLTVPHREAPFELLGEVVWSKADAEEPGMGIRFIYNDDRQRGEERVLTEHPIERDAQVDCAAEGDGCAAEAVRVLLDDPQQLVVAQGEELVTELVDLGDRLLQVTLNQLGDVAIVFGNEDARTRPLLIVSAHRLICSLRQNLHVRRAIVKGVTVAPKSRHVARLMPLAPELAATLRAHRPRSRR